MPQNTSETRSYRAVPVLIYVPLTDDEEADIARAVESARSDLDLGVFVAEDYALAVVTEHPDICLSASISATCNIQ